jgi:SAM-dependent methyltransferase
VHDDGYFDERVAARYDESEAEMFDPAAVDPVVDFLAELAGGGRALELGIGTGRIALPLAKRGVPVHGIDLSKAMVARLHAKPGGRNVAAHLEPGGCFVVEVGIPELRRLPPGETVRAFHVSKTRWGFDEFDVANQGLVSHHFELVDGRVERVSIPFRYTWPAELDLMAELAGMSLRERWSGWKREPFTNDSRKHISVWEKPAATP